MTEFTCILNRAFSRSIFASMLLNTWSAAPFGVADPAGLLLSFASCARSFACLYGPKLVPLIRVKKFNMQIHFNGNKRKYLC